MKSEKEISEILNGIYEVYNSNRWSNGDYTKSIDRLVRSNILDNQYFSLPCCNGTMALATAIKTCEIVRNKKITVAMPIFTSVAVKLAVEMAGAKILYYQLDNNWNVDLPSLSKVFWNKIDVMIVVHTGGLVDKNIQEISGLCAGHKKILIEDISHSQCSEYQGVKAGVNSDITIFSMYATKSLSSGEGGVISLNMTNNSDWQEVMYCIWNAGRDNKEKQILTEGFNSRSSEFQSCIMASRIENYDEELSYRSKLAKMIDVYIPEKCRLHQFYDTYSFYKYIVISDKAKKIIKELPKGCFTGKVYPGFAQYAPDNIFKNEYWLLDNHFCINLNIEKEYLVKIESILKE